MIIIAAYCLIAAHPGPAFKHGGFPLADAERASLDEK
jgi:hypothetical protein